MNGFTENRAPGASEQSDRDERPLTWGDSVAMLPLVGRVAVDVQHYHKRLAGLRPELARLERARLNLAWPQRARRYQVQEEIAAIERELQTAVSELQRLGVAVLDGNTGLVGFPTVVDDRRAFFSWMPGEEGLGYWNFAGDTSRRPVLPDWTKPVKNKVRSRGKSRREKK
jgi:hypothetical protein